MDHVQHAVPARVRLRAHRPGDMGWIVMRHAEIYAQEQGWGASFEALVAEIVGHFLRHLDAAREQCWIAELDGVRAGSVMLVRHPERAGVAQLRVLLVEPAARGHGIGARLVRACTEFARATGYHTITLSTDGVLHSARRLYEAEGYRLVREEPQNEFGSGRTRQVWELKL